MASISIINKIKYTKWLYFLYFHFGSFSINLVKKILKPNDKLLLFTSYSGKKYDDSPKDIYEQMIKDYRFKGYEFVWAFRDPKAIDIPHGRKIKIDTISYFITALKARVWITNVSMTRGLDFRGINTFSINSWHGTAIKKIGNDALEGKKTFKSKSKHSSTDAMLAQSEYDMKIFSHAFSLPKESIFKTGLPRNDSLISNNYLLARSFIKEKLQLSNEKKVILYAPTFREYERGRGNCCLLRPPFDLDKLKEALGENYVLLVRAHQEVVNILGLEENEFVKNVSSYPILNELLLITDILISDYSSIMFDFSILKRPIICYLYDYDRYEKERGFYFDIRNYLPYAMNEDDLVSLIEQTEIEKDNLDTIKFQETFVTEYGNSALKAVDIIYNALFSKIRPKQ